MYIKDELWANFEEQGYLRLGRVLEDDDLSELKDRIEEIMLGKADVDYDRLLMQLDCTSGKYEDAGEQSTGWKGSSLAYRKIQNLEIDPIFRDYIERPIFQDICARAYGYATEIACFRAMFMNQRAEQGAVLLWRQDAWSYLDRQPIITIWTALDPATKENGCVEVLSRTHHLGLINPSHRSGFLSEEQAKSLLEQHPIEYLELDAGEAMLLHNWLVHGSNVDHTDSPRRGFSVCYMEAETRSDNGDTFTRLFSPELAER